MVGDNFVNSQDLYSDGFVDGQLNLIEIFDECIEESDGRVEAFELFQKRVTEIRKDIESL